MKIVANQAGPRQRPASLSWKRQTIGLLVLLLTAGSLFSQNQRLVQYDSSEVNVRHFDENQRQAYLEDEAYQYDRLKPEPAETGFLERLWKRFWDFLLKKRVGDYSAADMIGYLLGAGALLFIIFGLLKVNIRGILDRSAKRLQPDFQVEEEELTGMDFEALVAEATLAGDFQRAVRLLYLETLRDLTRTGSIRWRPDKTNHDYLDELQGTPLYQDFEALTLRYEYTCYGDFPIDKRGFEEMQQTFRAFRKKMTAVS